MAVGGARRARWAVGALAVAALLVLAGGGSDGPAASPAVTEIDLPDAGGSTHELTLGPDGDVWVTQQNTAKLVRVSPRGHVRVFALPPGSGPHGIKFDRRGRLWVTLEFANAIARVGLDGRIVRRYPIARANAGPHGLDVARDGSVWWTGKEGGVIGRLDPATGRMRVFSLPNGQSLPIYIAQGCDGLYFTELNAGRIGRVKASGKITEWKTPTPGSRPIAVAPRNCRIWFSEEASHRYGVLDPRTGRIVEYPLRRPTDELASLAFDRLGTLWLQHVKPDVFGRAGRGREASTFPIPTTHATMHRIILGPGGRMWFTELASDKVGSFDPGR
jgi:virginiamycin B lyase